MNIHAKKIKTEKIDIILQELFYLESVGYQFKSFTIDGRTGLCRRLKEHFPDVPIQLCQFHQKMIIRRYITDRPKLECSKELKKLLKKLTTIEEKYFKQRLKKLEEKYAEFLQEKNDKGEFSHKRLRSALRSLNTNLPYLFTSKNYSRLKIPNTTNSIESNFSCWKNKVKIHKGLRPDRKDKIILFLIKNS